MKVLELKPTLNGMCNGIIITELAMLAGIEALNEINQLSQLIKTTPKERFAERVEKARVNLADFNLKRNKAFQDMLTCPDF